jgi:hypothetical protein
MGEQNSFRARYLERIILGKVAGKVIPAGHIPGLMCGKGDLRSGRVWRFLGSGRLWRSPRETQGVAACGASWGVAACGAPLRKLMVTARARAEEKVSRRR